MICENTNTENKMDIEEQSFMELAKSCNQAIKLRILNFVE